MPERLRLDDYFYTTHYPCSWCAKSIVNAGIARVIYDEDYPDPLAKDILSAIQVQRTRNSSAVDACRAGVPSTRGMI